MLCHEVYTSIKPPRRPKLRPSTRDAGCLELCERLGRGLVLADAENVESDGFGEGSALADVTGVTLLTLGTRASSEHPGSCVASRIGGIWGMLPHVSSSLTGYTGGENAQVEYSRRMMMELVILVEWTTPVRMRLGSRHRR